MVVRMTGMVPSQHIVWTAPEVATLPLSMRKSPFQSTCSKRREGMDYKTLRYAT